MWKWESSAGVPACGTKPRGSDGCTYSLQPIPLQPLNPYAPNPASVSSKNSAIVCMLCSQWPSWQCPPSG